MIAAALLLLAAPAVADVPRGVNGTVLGTAEEFAFAGPGRVCLNAAWVDLAAGEIAHLDYSGIHYQTITITGAEGRLELKEGDIWARPKGSRTLVLRRSGMTVYDVGDANEFRYLAYAPDPDDAGRMKPRVWLDGDLLRGDASDRRILARLNMGAPSEAECQIRYNYGWGVLLDGDPMVIRKNKATQ